ncbi:BnaA03g52820D [Brassica napus]|uniref:pyruvate kinase n=1 Tax=Brassica napus TaxID=3708 RepID=A0A078I7C0_BRANA|nr:BnaA03g52820D [Brassica napus]
MTMKSTTKYQLTTGKSPVAVYFNKISPGPAESQLRFRNKVGQVCDTENGTVRCRCENSAMLSERKNVNLPGVVVDLPTLTEKDKEDIMKWGVPNQIDMIALSFVRKGSDLVQVRKLLRDHAKNILLMSKVENQEGVANFDDILVNSDAFMIARGDLGMEIPIEKIFLAQKVMIYKCNIQGKPVVTAIQMLESMIKSPRPTRAEATDVANAVLDGTDCVMLSGETAAGAYPELARIMQGGSTARLVAKYRPGMPILSVVVPGMKIDFFDWSCSDESPARHSLIFRRLIPVLYAGSARASHDESTEEAIQFAT